MTRFAIAALGLAAPLALAACQQPAADNATATTNTAAPAEDYLARIAALPPGQQQLVLFRAIRDAQQDCQNIIKTERLADVDGRAAWRVTCRRGAQYAVTIGRDGIANVTGPVVAR